VTLDALLDRCEVIVCGIDGGGLDDIAGFAAIGREKGTRKWLHYAKGWVFKSALERRKSIAPTLRDFEVAGDLGIVDNIGDDIEELVSVIERIDRAGLLPDENAIGVDPIGIGQVLDALAARGIDNTVKKRIVGIAQGWQLGRAIKTLERRVADGSFVHGAQPLMAWCVSNAKVEQRANGILITKQASGTAKIDPLMATFNATDLMSLDPPLPGGGPSIYETRNILVVSPWATNSRLIPPRKFSRPPRLTPHIGRTRRAIARLTLRFIAGTTQGTSERSRNVCVWIFWSATYRPRDRR
jgi:phage terminase large subunit-like protein